MYNQLAVRLADFLLHHRNHEVKAEQKVGYRRWVNHRGSFLAKVDTRGFLYERLGCPAAAAIDFRRYLELAPDAEDLEQVRTRLSRLLDDTPTLH